jgi:Mrp family chromosome partitioning ATPase
MDLVPEKKHNPRVKRAIGVVSGKGGVGKSTVAVLLAQARSLRWSELPEEVQKDAAKLAFVTLRAEVGPCPDR